MFAVKLVGDVASIRSVVYSALQPLWVICPCYAFSKTVDQFSENRYLDVLILPYDPKQISRVFQ